MNNISIMDLENLNTAELLPSSISDDPDVQALLKAIDAYWKDIAPKIHLFGVLSTINEQPEDVVDKLAYQFHVDYYDFDWPLETKRKAVIDSYRLHRIAGTRGAVEDLIKAIWDDGAIIQEWWEYGGEPGTFSVILTNDNTRDNVTRFVQSIRSVKRATDHLTIATVNDTGDTTLYAQVVYFQVMHYYL